MTELNKLYVNVKKIGKTKLKKCSVIQSLFRLEKDSKRCQGFKKKTNLPKVDDDLN